MSKTSSENTDVINDLAKQEFDNVAAVIKKLEPSNVGVADLFDKLEMMTRTYSDARKSSTKARNELLCAVYELYLIAVKRGEQGILREKLREQGVRMQLRGHLLIPLVRWCAGKSRGRAQRWAAAMRCAISNNVTPNKLTQFFTREGGIEECANQFQKLEKGNVAKFEKRKTPKARAAAVVQPKFTAECVADLERLKKRNKQTFIKIFGQLSAAGILTLDMISRDPSAKWR